MAITKWRKEAVDRLGGIRCAGLSFIGGPNCPVPKKLLILDDINVGHRAGLSGDARRYNGGKGGYYKKIALMQNPEKTYINLCTLCNQRMRHSSNEFGFINLPKKAIVLYKKHRWTLEEIAENYDCSYPAVSNFLKRSGVKIRKGCSEGGKKAWMNPWSRKNLLEERRKRFMTPVRMKLARRMSVMRDEGDSLREIAQWFSTTHASVQTHLKLIGEL